MTFYEWFDKTFYEDKFKSIARDAWKAAQEDMRERAARDVEQCIIASDDGPQMSLEYVAHSIRALPIEV